MVGDLLGPALFAVFMGLGRTAYGLWGPKLNLYHALLLTGGLCVFCYLGASLFRRPWCPCSAALCAAFPSA